MKTHVRGFALWLRGDLSLSAGPLGPSTIRSYSFCVWKTIIYRYLLSMKTGCKIISSESVAQEALRC